MTAASFVTDWGVLVPAISSSQMRTVDRIAIEETGPNLYQMMENAGRSLAVMTMESLGPLWRTEPIVVLAGTGGNGGGGICAARHLANRGGDVTVMITDQDRLGEGPAGQLDIYRGTAGSLAQPEDLAHIEPSLIVDALIGYSLTGPPRGVARGLIEWAGEAKAPRLALDVPSGLDATTGEAVGAHVEAAVTMTLALPKTGLDVRAVGELWVADIGIPAQAYHRAGIEVPSDLFDDDFVVLLQPDNSANG